MIIQTPRLCNDVAFLPPQKDSPNRISCSPIIPPDEIDDYERDTKDAAEGQDIDNQIPNPFEDSHTNLPPSIGGIILGAHKWISEDQRVLKSSIVGGEGKETYIETIANSMGKMLAAEQLKQMGLGDAKRVEKLKKELENIANGQSWKLDVFDTPDGREYRGILLGDEDGEGDGKEKDGAEKQEETEESNESGENQGSEETYKDEL